MTPKPAESAVERYPKPQSMEDVRKWRECDHEWEWECARMLCRKCGWARPADDTLEYAQEALAELKAKLAVAEAQFEECKRRRERDKATIERLKCCGNCRNFDLLDGLGWCFHGDELENAASFDDPCHFTPSRWQRRES